tara:strand:- start:685 stop:1509 length:825 start_codon:yes stop_codon:yes gene_type:complete
MITINTWNQNYIIAHDPDYLIDTGALNKLFISLVDKIGDNNQEIERAKRKDEYLVIAGHANIKYEKLRVVIQDFLKGEEIGYDWKDDISAEDIELFKELNFFPAEDPSIGSFGGGASKDTPKIELGIEPLVDALNMFDGIRTFGSCEGHNNHQGLGQAGRTKAYVSWTACNIDGLNYSTFLLKNAINKVFEKRGLNRKEGSTAGRVINLNFNTGYWKPARYRKAPLPGENYYHFEYEYNYDPDTQKLVFDVIADIAEDMVNEKYKESINNTKNI